MGKSQFNLFHNLFKKDLKNTKVIETKDEVIHEDIGPSNYDLEGHDEETMGDELEIPYDFLKINHQAYSLLYYYTQAAPHEVSGLGHIKALEEDFGIAHIDKIYLLDQASNEGYTLLDEEAVMNFICDRAEYGQNPEEYNLWWHVHPSGFLGWSQEDEEMITRHSQNLPFVSLLMDKNGLMIARADFKGETAPLRIAVMPKQNDKLMSRAYEEVKKKVKYLEHTDDKKLDDIIKDQAQEGIY